MNCGSLKSKLHGDLILFLKRLSGELLVSGQAYATYQDLVSQNQTNKSREEMN